MPPSSGTRGRKRKRPVQEEVDDTPGEVAMEVTREALEMLRETLSKLADMMQDACHGCPDNLQSLQLDAMTIHTDIMGLHFDMISVRASDENIERDAHSFQRRAFKLHQTVNKLQPQSAKPRVTGTRIKYMYPTFKLWSYRTNLCILRLKGRPRRHAQDLAATQEGPGNANVAIQTEDVETADVATQTMDLEPSLPKVSATLQENGKIGKIPRFFLDTLSGKRYEEFNDGEVIRAFEIGSRLAEFMQNDVLFQNEYSNLQEGLIGDLFSQYTKREDWGPRRGDAVRNKWFSNSKELLYAHYALEVLETWRAQRGTETVPTATIKPLYWALEATEKQIAYGVRWMRYLKVQEPVSVLIICMIVENTRSRQG
ncbi:hypothetical protein PG996_012601 [Apiospora saccharicola]|uniref:Uncharacterized protein n=1 Tax=Apiospora saccharicola TaxID=335842 RepID=A0ABR1U5G0_9PEZI